MPAGRLLSEGEKGRIKAYNDAGFIVSEIWANALCYNQFSKKSGRIWCEAQFWEKTKTG